MVKFRDESTYFSENKEYLISTSNSSGNGISANGTNIENETISTTSIPSNSAKWIFEMTENNTYYIKNVATGGYLYVNASSGYWGDVTASLEISSSDRTAFSIQGSNSKTISYDYTYSSWWNEETETFYLNYNNGWNVSSSTSGTTNLYFLTYEKIDDVEINDMKTLVNIQHLGGTVKNNIFGGANQNDIYGTVKIDISAGSVNGVVYGGSNLKGTIYGSSLIDIYGGTFGNKSTTATFDYTSVDAIFGGGLGESTDVKGRTRINITDKNKDVIIYGNVYGGSSLGKINSNVTINVNDSKDISNKINITGNLFGGGKGNSNISAIVFGNITVEIDGGELSNCSVFGGSNLNGNINGTIMVTIGGDNNTNLYAVYGGGNQASINTDTKEVYVYLLTNATIENAFNGGKSADLLSSGEKDKTRAIYLQGATVKNIYGGSDTEGTVTSSNVYIETGTATNVYGGNNQGGTTINSNVNISAGIVENVYGGGEKAETTTSNINTIGGSIQNIYGGGSQAGVITTNVTINGGDIINVFGGSNISGEVNTSNVKTNDFDKDALTMKVEYNASKTNTWDNTTYKTQADIKVTITNNTSKPITKWNSYIYAKDSIIKYNYTSSDIVENNGMFTLNEKNKYYGTNSIPANGTFSIDFGIFSNQEVDNFEIKYGLSGTDSTGNMVSNGNGKVKTVYGGNNHGGTTQTTNVNIKGEGIQNVYGGGNQAITNETNVSINGNVEENVFGGGNQAGVNTNTNLIVTDASIGDNVYGGGNEGIVSGNTYVNVKNSTLDNCLYAGGNGVSAIVYGNTNLIMQGNNNVAKNVFGGGNQAATGEESSNNSSSTVNIVGATIGGNLYGGANTSVVYGTTQTNVGYNTVGDDSLEIGNIEIAGTIFGGGEANASGSEIYDFSFISVTKGINIEIDGKDHTKFSIKGSIFGSGNASSTSGKSYIDIKNYGTADNPQSNISIQRADCATISNSAISLSGATDRTNEYSSVFFSLSRVDQVKLKNNSILYLCNGANLLKNLDSLVDNNGVEEKAVVTIDPETGDVTNRNVDNRIYMLEGKNLNVATNEQATAYGQVHGMFFLGLFTNRKNPGTSTGFYHKGYENGDEVTNAGTFSSNSYVMAQHMVDHETNIDGFYTNYNKEGKIKVEYVDTTPKDDVYYIWLVGEEIDVTKFQVDLAASKYATLGTYELLLKGFANPNIKMTLVGFSSGLAEGISLVDPDEIKIIEQDDERANSVFGLAMKTGNVGWQTKGSTKFLTQNGGAYTGTSDYNKDNTSYTPTINLCFYHSENITKKQALGDVRIRLQVLNPIDDLNYSLSYIDIEITLSSALYQNDFYEAAITPGQEYGLFTTTETTITDKSTFSTYYSLYIDEFSNSKYVNDYENYQRVLVSRNSESGEYSFPENTKITMLDMVTNKYYYYIVTADDVKNNKYIYKLCDFLAMGSNDSKFDEKEATKLYYNNDKDLIYENFIFHINFADSEINENIQNNSLLMELRDQEDQILLGVLGIQRESMVYTVYTGKEATIKLDANLTPEVLYLGKTLNMNVITKLTQVIVDSKTIYDTQYFDQKLGIKISIFDNNGNKLNLDSLFGINFELDGQLYYPRVDGTTRINIANKVTDVLAKIKMNTSGNTTLASGEYKILIESFGSPDGIYYGLTASDQIELSLRIINSAYGLKVTNSDISKIIDKETGNNENGNNILTCTIEYSSKFTSPRITVALYRRDYSEEFSQEYQLVDFQDYVSYKLTRTNIEKEYVMSNDPKETTVKTYTLNENLMTGTYKIVYKLYDENIYVGEAFDYMVIK